MICGKNGCTQPLRQIEQDEGWCLYHGSRYLLAPMALPEREVSHQHPPCVDCGKPLANPGAVRCHACRGAHQSKGEYRCIDCGILISQGSTRCKPCANKVLSERARNKKVGGKGFASQPLGPLSQRTHDWVMPK